MDPLAILIIGACAVILVYALLHEERDRLDYTSSGPVTWVEVGCR